MARTALDYTNEILNDDCSGSPDNWTNGNSATHTFSGGKMTVIDNNGSASEYIYKNETNTNKDYYFQVDVNFTSGSSTPIFIQLSDDTGIGYLIAGAYIDWSDGSLYARNGNGWTDTTVNLSTSTDYVIKFWGDATAGTFTIDVDGTEYGTYTSDSAADTSINNLVIGGGSSGATWTSVFDNVIFKDTYVPYTPPTENWLGTWAKRRKVVVSNTNIDSNLTHFPLLLTLGTSVGTGNTDVSSIFDELTSDANRLKIALTKTDGTTQLYGEIEKWDDANETAVIWVSKDDLVLSSTGTTDIYMYYDSAQSANTTYIGDTNDEVAENVWDSNFTGIYHLNDGASTSATYDSTSNDNDGTKTDANEPNEVTEEIGESQDFDGTDDIINLPSGTTSSSPFDITDELTISAIIKIDDLSIDRAVLDLQSSFSGTASYNAGALLTIESEGAVYMRIGKHVSNDDIRSSASEITTGTTYYVTGVMNNTAVELFKNGASLTTDTVTSGNIEWNGGTYNDNGNYIGQFLRGAASAGQFYDGVMDELRVSTVARSDAWIKADYYTLTDDIVAWSTEEEYVSTATGNAILFGFNF